MTHTFDRNLVADYLEASHAVGEYLLDAMAGACEELEVPYFLTSGTLLGAVRSGSWIPWDDDIDVMLFRSDYKRLAPQIAGRLPEGVLFSSAESRRDHITVIPRLLYLPSRRVHAGRHRSNVPIETQHVPLDIFILDRAPASDRMRIVWTRVARALDLVAVARYTSVADVLGERSIGPVRRFAELLGVLMAMVLPRRAWLGLRTIWACLPERWGSRGPFMAFNYGTPAGRLMSFERDWYLPASSVEFVGRQYPAPGNQAAVLTALYGPDFLVPPAEIDREPQHIRGGLHVDLGHRSWTIERALDTAADAPPEVATGSVRGAGATQPEGHLSGRNFRIQVLWSLTARAGSALLQVLILVLLARGLPPYLFAFVIAINVVLQVVVAVNGFGLLRQIEYRRSRDATDASLPSLFQIRLAFSWASAALWVVACCVAFAVTDHAYFIALMPAAAWLLVEQTTQVWNGLAVVDGRSRDLVQSYVARRLPVVAFLFGGSLFGLTKGDLIWTWTLGLAAGSALSYAIAVRQQESWARVWWPRRSQVHERIPFDLGYWWGLVGIQLRDLDVATVGAVNPDLAGLYAFPARLVSPMNLVTVAAGTNAFPRVARHGITRRQLRKGILFGLMPVVLIAAVTAAAAPLLPNVIGDDYQGSIPVLRVMCLTAVVSGAATLLSLLLQALSTRDARVVGYLSLGFALAQIVCAALAAAAGGAVLVASVVATVNAALAASLWVYANRRVALT